MTPKIIAYCDGGSRNNPGPAAIGVVIIAGKEKRKEYDEFIGQASNNEAEYQAVIFALKKIKQLWGKEKSKNSEIEIRGDSELLMKQINGEYKIKEKNLQPLFLEIWNLKLDFGKIKFIQIPREENKEADFLVNQALDKQQKITSQHLQF